MFNNQKRYYTALFLLFCVATSKGIIIYNEEILVALTFVLFIIFCGSYFGSTIKESLDERSSAIKSSLEQFHRDKEDSLKEALSLHKRIKEAKKVFPSIEKNTQNQLSHIRSHESESGELYNSFCEQVQQKLKDFTSSKSILQQQLQKSIALALTVFVIVKKVKSNGDKKKSMLSYVLSKTIK